jgi:hypothetical protein
MIQYNKEVRKLKHFYDVIKITLCFVIDFAKGVTRACPMSEASVLGISFYQCLAYMDVGI